MGRLMDGRELDIEVQADSTVQLLRSQVAQALGIQVPRVRLISGIAALPQRGVISAYGVTDGSAVNVIVLPPLYGNLAENGVTVPDDVMANKLAMHEALEEAGRLRARHAA